MPAGMVNPHSTLASSWAMSNDSVRHRSSMARCISGEYTLVAANGRVETADRSWATRLAPCDAGVRSTTWTAISRLRATTPSRSSGRA